MQVKQRIYTLLIVLAVSAVAFAQPQFTPGRTVANVGEIMFQAPRKVKFEYTNTGSEPLVVSSVHPSCGCTSVAFSSQPLEPGGIGEIEATYDAKMLGVFYKELEVLTNASPEPVYLTIQGKVTTEPSAVGDDFPIDLDNVRMTTNAIEFDNVNMGDQPVFEIQILNTTRQAYQPQLMHLPSYLEPEYLPRVLAGGRVGRILVKLNSNELPSMGLTQTSIYLARYNGDKIGADNEIAVSAILLPDLRTLNTSADAPHLTVESETINLGAWGSKQSLAKTLTITNTGRTNLDVSRLQVLNRGLEVSLDKRTIAPGGKAKLKVKLQRKYVGRDKNRMAVLLITNDPDAPKRIIDVKVE